MATSMVPRSLPWAQQPTLVQRINPLFSPLAVVLPCGDRLQNITEGNAEIAAERTGTGVSIEGTRDGYGAGASAQSTNSYRLHSVANQTNTVWERPTSQVSILLYCIRYGNAAGNAPIFANCAPNTAPYSAWSLIDAGGVGIFRFECSAGGTYRSLDAFIGITNNALTVAIATYDGATMQLFQNGAAVGTLATSGALTYPSAVDRGPVLGNFWDYTGSSRAFVGRVLVAALWDRALLDNEVASLSANPWQLFAPRRIWVPQAGITGLPTLSASTYTPGSLASGGWRPRITAT